MSSNIHYLNQIHSNKIINAKNTSNTKPVIADCLITKERNQSLWIYTADCMPILFADKKTRNVSACHVGLKGLKNKIIEKTLTEIYAIGSKKDNLIIAIGPSISGDHYQVKIKDIEQLIIDMKGKSINEKTFDLIQDAQKQVLNLLKKDSRSDRILFNMQSAAILQLRKEGIKKDQISINNSCTYSNPKLFNSWRRNHTLLRQWSCIYS